MAHHSLRYFILACFVIIIFLFILAFLDTLVDERKILATPTISKKKAVFTALASTKINARAQDVFNVLLDFKRYGKWNTHTIYEWNSVTADGSPLVGTKGKVKVYLSGRSPITSSVQFTMIHRETKTLASKQTSFPGWLLKAERVYEVVPIRNDLCEFRTWETFGGLMSFMVKYFTSSGIEESGMRCAENLRNYVENSKGLAQPGQASDSLLYH